MMRFLTLDDVFVLRRAIDAPGALIERKRSDLESALTEPRQTWSGRLLHDSVEAQAAALLRGIVAAHAFEDGNKRTAWTACVTFLDLNGVDLRVAPLSASDLVVRIATDRLSAADIAEWIAEHSGVVRLEVQR